MSRDRKRRFDVYMRRKMGTLYEYHLVRGSRVGLMESSAQGWRVVVDDTELDKARHWTAAKRQGNLHLKIKRGHKRGNARH